MLISCILHPRIFSSEEYSLYVPICIGLLTYFVMSASFKYACKVVWPVGSWYFILEEMQILFSGAWRKICVKSHYSTSFAGSSWLVLLDSRFLRKTVSSDIAKQEVEASCHQNGACYEPWWQPWPYLWPGRIRTSSILNKLLVKGGSTTINKITKVLDK